MRKVYISVMIAATAAILFSRIRFIRNAFDPNHVPPPASAESSPYGPDSISESAIDTGDRKIEPERATPAAKPKASPTRPPADD